MYDKSLEQLIDAVIADGIITAQERKVVYKKAATLGIDRDEIEVYLEGRLHEFLNTDKNKSGKYGGVITCPNCGANVPSFATKCNECGFEFRDTEAVSSMNKLFVKLNITRDIDKKCEIIRTFPIPNNKEDLLEFISASESNSKEALGILATRENHWITGFLAAFSVFVICLFMFKSEGESLSRSLGFALIGGFIPEIICLLSFGLSGKPSKIAKAWEVKLNTALNKINVIAKNDPDIKVQANNIVASYHKKKLFTKSVFLGWLAILITFTFIAISMPSTRVEEREKDQLEWELKKQQKKQLQDSIEIIISDGEYEKADKLIKTIDPDKKDYFEFLQKCVEDMGAHGKYKDAKNFIKRKSLFFETDYSWNKEYERDIVIDKLNMVVDSYK